MLVCYLDDSGKDAQNPLSLVAGYVARDTAWEAFETAVEPWFVDYEVPILHATDLKGTRGYFKGWPVLKKQAFVSRICQARNPHVMMGVSMAVAKAPYATYRASKAPAQTSSPYAFCLGVIVDWILRDIRTGGAANTEGLALIVECGHENNAEAAAAFYEVRRRFGLEGVLHSISFVPKESCRAIQLADLYAFYSRRSDVAMLKAREKGRDRYPADMMIRLLADGVPYKSVLATNFDDSDDPVKPALFPPGDV